MNPEANHKRFTLGFSPCPNDTFIFDALVNQKIDTQGYLFDVHLEDVQTLNEWALAGKLDFSKISYGVLPLLTDKYTVLESGGALGKGVGPLLVSKHPVEHAETAIQEMKIAIPGMHTTAHMLFSLAFPAAKHKEFLVFNEIEDAVLSGKVDAGVIIHENRFTYQAKGLHRLIDLGAYWESHTKLPIPLGGIVANKKIDTGTALQVDKLIKKSVEYAFSEYPHISSYVQQHAQEMNSQVMKQHIDLYVNDFSLWLGQDGKKAVMKLLEVYEQMNPSQSFSKSDIFIV
jgi:1,4-dihydroxy-6-naphthoate synthase